MVENKEKVLNLIGLSKRAGKIVTGDDTVMAKLRGKKLDAIFIACDASPRTIDKYDKKCFFYNCLMINIFNQNELSKAIGKENIKIIGLSDKGFFEAIKKLI